MKHSVYWIHRSIHSDPYHEGYIGISKNPTSRFKQHSKDKRSIVSHAIAKYEDVTLTILHQEVELEEAIKLELKYRNAMRIGWNICVGGGLPPTQPGPLHHNYGRKHSLSTRKILSERKTGSCHPNYGKQLKESTKQKISAKQLGFNNHRYGKTNTPESNSLRSEALRGVEKEIVTCPHCLVEGGKPSMRRWHFDNCKMRRD